MVNRNSHFFAKEFESLGIFLPCRGEDHRIRPGGKTHVQGAGLVVGHLLGSFPHGTDLFIRAKLFAKQTNETDELEEIVSVKGDGAIFYQEMSYYIKNDEELIKIMEGNHPLYTLEFYNNNWLEVDLLNKEEEYEGLDIVLDSSSVKDAVKEVIKMIPDIEKELDSEKYYE